MKKRLYFVLASENLFHPSYCLSLLQRIPGNKYHIVGITVEKQRLKKGFLHHLKEQYFLWGLLGFTAIALTSITKTILDKLHIHYSLSIKSIAKKFSIPYSTTENINNPSYIKYLKRLKIDIIISSSGLIFKEDLLSLPKIASINRHTAMLPKYGGVLPVFWAMFHNEHEFGVSVHFMTKKVDQGDILYQRSIPIEKKNSLFTNYVLGFEESVWVTIKALENLHQKKIKTKFHTNSKQYFTYPEKSTMINFRKKYKTFTLKDLRYILIGPKKK